ncbi:MAG TPA: hypothetical protein VGV38_11510 [Pyrinomonadaceae bacterium]|nr:hypothetical protein [Pyrinomonadaceae bacterium]
MSRDTNNPRARRALSSLLAALACLCACAAATTGPAAVGGADAHAVNSSRKTSAHANGPGVQAQTPTPPPARDTSLIASGTRQDETARVPLADYRGETEHVFPNHIPRLTQEQMVRQALGTGAEGDSGRPRDRIYVAGHGAFTKADKSQTVYISLRDGPGASDPLSTAGTLLAVFEGERFVCKLDASGTDWASGPTDLDRDGLKELLLEGGALNMGTSVTRLRLVELKRCRLNVVHDFGEVLRHTCGTAGGGEIIAALVTFAPKEGGGGWPEFFREAYRAPCPAEGEHLTRSAFLPAPDAYLEP